MNLELTKEQQIIKKAASDFAKSVLEPDAFEQDRNAEWPEKAVKEMAAKAYCGMTIPKTYGGTEMDFTEVVSVAEAFGQYNASAAAILITHAVAAAQTIVRYGTEDQKKKYLPAMAEGRMLGGYALAEPGAALASGENKVTAAKSGDGYLLNGKKTCVGNGGKADVYVVIAQTDEEAGQKGISAFLVEKNAVTIDADIDKLGLRSFATAAISLKDAKATLLGAEKDGPSILADIQARLDIANTGMAAGVGVALLEASAEHAKTRVQFGAPIAKIQAVQWMLADIAESVHLMQLLEYQAAGRYDAGGDYIREAAFAKMYAMKASQAAGMNGVQIHGGTGYSREAKIERYFRDIRGAFHIENASEFPQKIIVSTLLK